MRGKLGPLGQRIDQPSPLVRMRVHHERSRFLGRRKHSEHVEVRATHEHVVARKRGRVHPQPAKNREYVLIHLVVFRRFAPDKTRPGRHE